MGLSKPLDIALIGTGHRSQVVYRPIFAALRREGVRLVAVCDPVREHADAYAESLGVPAFYSIRELVRALPMEAAVVTAPVEVHHAISCYLSENGIHSVTETSMADTLAQAQDMVRVAKKARVVMRVGEQFFRLPFERLAQRVAKTGFLGPIRRIISTFDHTGYHNNSSWVVFYGAHPLTAQAVEHTMPVAPHHSMAHRFHTQETFHAHFYTFPGDRLVADMTSNGKGLLGRYPRPGYTQIEGERGAIVWRAASRWNCPLHQGEGEVRYCSDYALETNGVADTVFPIVQMSESDLIKSMSIHLPVGHIEYINPFYAPTEHANGALNFYHAAVAEQVLDFARAVRGEETTPEFSAEDALMAMMMEVACRESILRKGEQIALPLTGDLESERRVHEALKAKNGVDPRDVEGMLARAIPRA